MNCPECSRDTPGNADRCAYCGARLGVSEAETGIGTVGRPIPTDADATQLGPPPAAFDPDATQLGAPPAAHDPDATQLGTSAPTRGSTGGATGSNWRDRSATGTGSTAGTRVPRSYGDAAIDLVGQPLGNRYQIIRLLGAGGMGAVYQAWDQDLSVVVALKTVRPEVAADPEAARMLERRFKQELLLARKVTHKNIVRVHDMGDVDGIKYITMPYLEGTDLSDILKAEGKLPVERVMPIARQVASGLAAAHAAGVVHRDLKPANIMMQANGEALIMDFGVARSTSGHAGDAPAGGAAPDLSAAHGHTMVGSVVGTLEYMAPEQAKAQPVDQRSDIYAFGLILYDLLLGRTRAKGPEGVFGELQQRMKEAPPAPKTKDPSIPLALDEIITRCIQPDAAARFHTTMDLVAALDRLDDKGAPIPIVRRLTKRMAAAAVVVLASLIGLTWWAARGPDAEVAHEPVSVLIADFQNGTGDATLQGTLEPVMQLALEGASFISAYDRGGIRRALGVRPPEVLNEQAALELAVKQGINVVLSGTVAQAGSRYDISVKAIQAVTGNVIATESERASSKDNVLAAATSLAGSLRRALGDTTSDDSAQRFAMETLSATSIEAVREYAKGMEALSQSKFEDALRAFSKAVELDPNFGTAYGGMAISSRNLDRQQDALKYADEAMRHTGGMTERERYRARGLYYYLTNDYKSCVKEYGDLIAKYSADPAARNNRALCLTYLRDLPTAVEEMRAVVKLLPNRVLYRENLALYTAYSGDFPAAELVVQEMPEPGLFALLARAFAELGQGLRPKATETYRALGTIDEEGASYMASGLGDLAIQEGRYSDAARILTQGAAADLAAKNQDRAALKFAALGYSHVLRGQKPAAIAAADKALANSQSVKIRFLAARVYVEAGATAKATKIAAELGGELQAEPQAYAAILEGLQALSAGNNRVAVEKLTAANTLFESWIGHFDLGRAYLAAKAYPQADSEFDRCITRRGEALSLFLDEEPTYGYFPSAYYYQGLVREGLRSTNFADSYRAYLDLRGNSKEDPLVADARKRAGG